VASFLQVDVGISCEVRLFARFRLGRVRGTFPVRRAQSLRLNSFHGDKARGPGLSVKNTSYYK
jgi:hypothetical protein